MPLKHPKGPKTNEKILLRRPSSPSRRVSPAISFPTARWGRTLLIRLSTTS